MRQIYHCQMIDLQLHLKAIFGDDFFGTGRPGIIDQDIGFMKGLFMRF